MEVLARAGDAGREGPVVRVIYNAHGKSTGADTGRGSIGVFELEWA